MEGPSASVINAIRYYVERMIDEHPGMKVLLLDTETKAIVSMVYSMTDIIKKNVYLVEKVDQVHEPMPHMKAICLLRPSRANMDLLRKELKKPKFAEYHLYFTCPVVFKDLESLAAVDEYYAVVSVQEFYCDYYAINHDLFTFNLGQSMSLSRPSSRWGSLQSATFQRAVDGILGTLLSMKLNPRIRYSGSSDLAASFARSVGDRIQAEREMFTPYSRDCLLMVLDRRDDPVAPLITPWTYQALIHEVLKLHNNRVDLAGVDGVTKELKEAVLSEVVDNFFKEHLHDTYWKLAPEYQKALEQLSANRGDAREKAASLAEIQEVMSKFPEFRSEGLRMSKHGLLLHELHKRISYGSGDSGASLVDISRVEQSIACTDDSSTHFNDVRELIMKSEVSQLNALRLVMLFALRYEKSKAGKVAELKQLLRIHKSLQHGDLELIDSLLKYAGEASRSGDLFGNKSVFAKMSSSMRQGFGSGSNNPDDVYSKYEPRVLRILNNISRNKLSEKEFPYLKGGAGGRPGTVIVFMVGGATYGEAARVAQFNEMQGHGRHAGSGGGSGSGGGGGGGSSSGIAAILGGTSMLNTKSFIDELRSWDSEVHIDIH